MIIAAILLLILSILEGSFISFPLVFIFLIFFSLRNRSSWVFVFAFTGGLLLDIFYLRQTGLTSIFFLVFLFAILLYERKFEIGNYFFVFTAILIGSFLYFSIFQGFFIWQKTLVTVGVSLILSRLFLKPKFIG